jgi:hypothetical protein
MEGEEPEADTAVAHLPAPRPVIEDGTKDPAPAVNQPPVMEGSGGTAQPLAARERAVLDFEVRRWKHAGAKEEAIRAGFGLSPTAYYQILNALLDDPAALAYKPALVTRLRRIRQAQRDARD